VRAPHVALYYTLAVCVLLQAAANESAAKRWRGKTEQAPHTGTRSRRSAAPCTRFCDELTEERGHASSALLRFERRRPRFVGETLEERSFERVVALLRRLQKRGESGLVANIVQQWVAHQVGIGKKTLLDTVAQRVHR
jgi:hypothetical protein